MWNEAKTSKYLVRFEFLEFGSLTCVRPEVFVICIIFVILTCFHLTNFLGEEKFSWLPSKKLADKKVKIVICHFRRKPAEFIFSKIFVRWKQVSIRSTQPTQLTLFQLGKDTVFITVLSIYVHTFICNPNLPNIEICKYIKKTQRHT